MVLLLIFLVAVYLCVGLFLGLMSQVMNPTGRIQWGTFFTVAFVTFMALLLITLVVLGIVGGVNALF